MVLGQHFFNRTTDVTQTFEVEKYIPYPLYSVFSPSDHDLGEARDASGRGGRGPYALCTPGPSRETGWGRAGGRGSGARWQGAGCGGAASA